MAARPGPGVKCPRAKRARAKRARAKRAVRKKLAQSRACKQQKPQFVRRRERQKPQLLPAARQAERDRRRRD